MAGAVAGGEGDVEVVEVGFSLDGCSAVCFWVGAAAGAGVAATGPLSSCSPPASASRRPSSSSFLFSTLLTLTPARPSRPFLLFLPFPTPHSSPPPTSSPTTPPTCSASLSAFSASSLLLRNSSKPSCVSFFTAASRARWPSCTESRNSISSSSRDRNWFVRREASSKASCLAAGFKKILAGAGQSGLLRGFLLALLVSFGRWERAYSVQRGRIW